MEKEDLSRLRRRDALAQWRDPEKRQRLLLARKSAEWRNRISEIHRSNGHRPKPSPVSLAFGRVLGSRWIPEYRVSMSNPGRSGGITGFFLDLAYPKMKLAIEVDGLDHLKKKERDRNRDRRLRKLGWTVFRVSENGVHNSLGVLNVR